MNYLIPLISLSLLLSCQQADSRTYYKESIESGMQEASIPKQVATVNNTQQGTLPVAKPLKIIKNAECKFLVTNVDSVTAILIKQVETKGGYVSDMNFNQNRYKIENKLTVSIPSGSFEQFVTSIGKLAKFVDYNTVTTKDVTAEFIDLGNRIKIKEAVKERYEVILRSKTKTIADVLNAEHKIQQIQEEIEVAKGRMKYINSKSAVSSIKLILYEQVTAKNKPEVLKNSFSNKSQNAFGNGWKAIQNILLVLINIWPLLLLGMLAYLFVKWKLNTSKTID